MTNFFSVYPRNPDYHGFPLEPVPLRVVRDDGFEVSTDINFDRIDLAGKDTIFRNLSGDSDSFTITVLLHKDDRVYSKVVDKNSILPYTTWVTYDEGTGEYTHNVDIRVTSLLDTWIRNAEPLYIVTQAVGLANKDQLWLVTEQKTRKQTYREGYVFWDLTFTKYKAVTIGNFKKVNDVMTKALEKKKNSSTSKNTDTKTKLRNALKKCDHEKMKYSKTKKVSSCVKTLQELLYIEGCFKGAKSKKDVVDGWYGKDTQEAVKAYKKKYAIQYGLNAKTGYLDYPTYKVVCGTAQAVVKWTTSAGNNLTTQVKNSTKNGVINVNVTKTTVKTGGDLKTTQSLSTVSVASTSMKSYTTTSKSSSSSVISVSNKATGWVKTILDKASKNKATKKTSKSNKSGKNKSSKSGKSK